MNKLGRKIMYSAVGAITSVMSKVHVRLDDSAYRHNMPGWQRTNYIIWKRMLRKTLEFQERFKD